MTAYRIPLHIVRQLGGLVPTHALMCDTLNISHFAADPGTVPEHIVAELGNGSPSAGRRVLNRFMAKIRSSKKPTNGGIIRGSRANAYVSVDRQ